MRNRAALIVILLALVAAIAVVFLLTIGPWGHHLQRPGKPPLGYLRAPQGGRQYRVTAWSLGDTGSLAAATGQHAIDEIDFDWYHTHADGSVTAEHENLDLVAAARDRELNIFATVTNSEHSGSAFSHTVAAAILTSPTLRRRYIDNLIELVETKGYDGIDLDWENLKATDRGRYAVLVEELAKALHAERRFLSIAVFPKTTEKGQWADQQAVDYRRIGAAVDEFKVMIYAYSGPWGAAGPQAPAAWANKVLDLAERLVPTRKISMGVPFYGYDWHGGKVTAVTGTAPVTIAAQENVPVLRDPVSGEAMVQYTDTTGVQHTIYFQDQQALAAKLDLLRQNHPKIAGISAWVMGQEGTGFWSTIEDRLK